MKVSRVGLARYLSYIFKDKEKTLLLFSNLIRTYDDNPFLKEIGVTSSLSTGIDTIYSVKEQFRTFKDNGQTDQNSKDYENITAGRDSITAFISMLNFSNLIPKDTNFRTHSLIEEEYIPKEDDSLMAEDIKEDMILLEDLVSHQSFETISRKKIGGKSFYSYLKDSITKIIDYAKANPKTPCDFRLEPKEDEKAEDLNKLLPAVYRIVKDTANS